MLHWAPVLFLFFVDVYILINHIVNKKCTEKAIVANLCVYYISHYLYMYSFIFDQIPLHVRINSTARSTPSLSPSCSYCYVRAMPYKSS